MVIVDTDVLVKCLQDNKACKNEVTHLLEMQAGVLTPIQIAEVNTHALTEELPLINAFFDLFKLKSFDRKSAELAGEFMQQYKPYYEFLTISDCLVAALASINGFEIYTLNPKHFPMTEVKLYQKSIEALKLKTKERLFNLQ